jgi:hypothetical protein
MSPSLRYGAALLAALFALPVAAQDDREVPAEEDDAVRFERDGNVYHFHITPPDGWPEDWREGARGFAFRDTVIDGRRVIRFHAPFGEAFDFEDFDVEDFDAEGFRRRVGPDLERFRAMPPDLFFEHGTPLGLPRMPFDDWMGSPHGLDEEARRELMALERRAHELAAEVRRAEGRDRAEAERALDEALERLFEMRGELRAAQVERLEERAERLREEAEELRRALRERDAERRALIEERKRELLGEPGADW